MNRRTCAFVGLALATSLVAGCGGEPQEEAQPQEEAAAAPMEPLNPLIDPGRFTETAPETYRVRMETSEGTIVIQVNRAWAPNGADRFYNLAKNGYYDDTRFYRVIPDFMAQFGLNQEPVVNSAWRAAAIPDDPVAQSNTRGRVTFAMAGPSTRTTQVFINFKDNSYLDESGFAPFGQVVEGMDVVDRIYSGYGETQPNGQGVDYQKAFSQGTPYLDESYPLLTKILSTTVETGGA